MNNRRYLIVGAGFSGAVVAEVLSSDSQNLVDVIDERSHIGGNCFTKRDDKTNIMVHEYGPHIFNTDNREVWNYISRFCEMIPYVNRVKAVYNRQIFSLPINLHTINQFYSTSFSPEEARNFIQTIGDSSIVEPINFEEQALKFIGRDLYEAFFYGYTKKQWGCEPTELPASILKRLPVRFNYNDNYYSTELQGIPKNGYTEIFEKMLNQSNINVQLGVKFDSNFDTSSYEHIFYTGPIDSFFDYKYGRLGYRTVYFDKYYHNGEDYQGNAVINYSNVDVRYTRVHEHKHFTPWEKHEQSVYFKEYSKETEDADIPYYPKRLANDLEILSKYQQDVEKLQNYTFLGRLATYRYMDMHHVIAEALEIAKTFSKSR